MTRRRLRPRSIASIVVVLLLSWLAREFGFTPDRPSGSWGTPSAPSARSTPSATSDPSSRPNSPHGTSGSERVAQAFAAHESGVVVTVEGTVDRVLADDRDESRHQRLLLRLADGATVLVAHNIELAERVPVKVGERLRLRGQYEWNERGGVLHWTHRDPRGDHPAGWIEHAGRRFE